MELAQYIRQSGPMVRDMRHDNDWAYPVLTLLIVLIIAGVVVYLIRSVAHSKAQADKATEVRAPLDIAKERYAKGEITKEELTEIKKELK